MPGVLIIEAMAQAEVSAVAILSMEEYKRKDCIIWCRIDKKRNLENKLCQVMYYV